MPTSRLLRTAATASMVSNARLNRQKRQVIKGATAAPAETPAAPAPTSDMTAQLQELANLHKQGILTDEEFAAKKKQILNI